MNNELLQRIENLERHNQRLTRALMAGFLLVTALLLLGAGSPTPHIRARSFQLVDADGQVKGRWIVNRGTPKFQLEHGQDRVTLMVGEHTPAQVNVYSEAQGYYARAGVLANAKDSASLEIWHHREPNNHSNATSITNRFDSTSAIQMWDEEQKERVFIGRRNRTWETKLR